MLSFPDLVASGPTTLDLTLDADAVGSGTVRRGDEPLAEITDTFAFDTPLAFAWCEGG